MSTTIAELAGGLLRLALEGLALWLVIEAINYIYERARGDN